MKKLSLIYSENKRLKPPSVFYKYSQSENFLTIQYRITNSPIFADQYRPKNRSCFGLWMMDVVEFFGRLKGNPTYYEFQVSPYGQFFELEVIEPVKRIDLDYKGELKKSASISKNKTSWNAKMIIPIESLMGNRIESFSKPIIEGNFFAILSKPFNRFYFSAFLPKIKKNPNFHQPKYFKKL